MVKAAVYSLWVLLSSGELAWAGCLLTTATSQWGREEGEEPLLLVSFLLPS